MGKTLIRVDCVDQRLFVTSPQSIASGGRNEDVVEFNFCPLWDGYAKTAVFYRSEDDVYHAVLSGNQCIIPHEVLQDDGIMYFGVFGTKGDTTRTSEVIRYRVVKGALTTGTKPSDPTPDIYAQIATKLADLGSFVKPSEPYSITGDLVQIDNYEGMPMDCVTHIEPVQAGNGDPSPDNIRPISGRTNAKLTRSGKNLLNDSLKYLDGNEIYFGGKKGDTAVTLPVGTYTFSMASANGNPSNLYIVNAVTREALLKAYDVHFVTFTLTDTTPLEFHVYRADYTSANDIVSAQVEIGATMTEHEPYQGECFALDFGQTVYGGTLDWGKGLLTVDRAMVSFDGTEAWSKSSVTTFDRYVRPMSSYGAVDDAGTLCSHVAYNKVMNAIGQCNIDGNPNFTWNYAAYGTTTLDGFKAYLAAQYAAGTPVQIAYKLAEPYTVQLTPQQITALQGVNYIWSDAGETTVRGRKDVLWLGNYLPTATATTKGGVRIGKGLRMDGDVLSVKQKKYELLYDTTVNDTGKNTVFTHTAGGREFYFSSVLLAVNAGEHDAANDDSTRFCCPPSPDQYWKNVVQLIWVAGMKATLSFWQEVYLDKGIWRARWTDPAHNKDMNTQRTCNTSNLDMTEEIYPAIKALYFPTLPPRARIRIWGVWKDD